MLFVETGAVNALAQRALRQVT